MRKTINKMYSCFSYYCPVIIKIVEYIYYYANNIFTNNKDYLTNIKEGEMLLNSVTEDNKYYYVITDKEIISCSDEFGGTI